MVGVACPVSASLGRFNQRGTRHVSHAPRLSAQQFGVREQQGFVPARNLIEVPGLLLERAIEAFRRVLVMQNPDSQIRAQPCIYKDTTSYSTRRK